MPNLKRPILMTVVAILALGGFVPAQAQEPTIENVCLAAVDVPGCLHGLPAIQYQMLLTQMLAHPTPDVREIELNGKEVRQYNYYKVNKAGTTVYDGPGGSPVATIDAGFNFVNPRQFRDGWAEINPGQWVPTSELTAVPASSFRGVVFDKAPAYPMAWMLLPTKPSPIPGMKMDKIKATFIPRYTRVNIFATVKVGKWDWYLIGPGQWVEQRRVGRVLPSARPEGVKGRWMAIDLYEQVLVAYNDDALVFATLISSGLPKWETNEGLFRIWARLKNDTMSGAMGRPDFYTVPNVPWVMYFDKDISLHGTYWHDGFGYRHSHGCVNLSISDARWLFEFTDNFYADTWVHVWASGRYEDRIG